MVDDHRHRELENSDGIDPHSLGRLCRRSGRGRRDRRGYPRPHARHLYFRKEGCRGRRIFWPGTSSCCKSQASRAGLLGLASVFRLSDLPADKAGEPPLPNSRRSVILKTMKPLYEQIGPHNFDIMVIPGNAILEVGQMAGAIVPTAKGTDPQVAAAVSAQKKESASTWPRVDEDDRRRRKNDAPPSYWFGIAQANFQDAIAADDPGDAGHPDGEIVSRAATRFHPVGNRAEHRRATPTNRNTSSSPAIQHGKPIDTVSRQLMLAKAKPPRASRVSFPSRPPTPATICTLRRRPSWAATRARRGN